MKKKIVAGIVIFSLIGVVSVVFLSLPKIKEASINSEIEKANYCTVESDCVSVPAKCPFGCWIYVNKNEVTRISSLIQSYESKCVYSCMSQPKVVCEDKKCTAMYK